MQICKKTWDKQKKTPIYKSKTGKSFGKNANDLPENLISVFF
jgi:hypothetical protein